MEKSTAATGNLAPKKAKSIWIFSPGFDLTWIVLCPVLSFIVLWMAWRWLGISDRRLYIVMFSFVVIGHHMPACLRAFGEPAIYHRYKARLWVALVALPAMLIGPTIYGFGMIVVSVAAIFDLWHVAMQQHGIGRIYSAKVGDFHKWIARLDLLCVLVWYTTIVLWSDAWMGGLVVALRKAGISLFDGLSIKSWHLLRMGSFWLSVLLLLMYLGGAWWNWQKHRRFPALKHLAHFAAFVVLVVSYQDTSWYRAQSTQNLFHAMQYFFLIWIYGHLANQKTTEEHYAWFYQGLFKGRRGILRFALLIGLYGMVFYVISFISYGLSTQAIQTSDVPFLPDYWSSQQAIEVMASIAVTSLLLHFYVDSFIWKVRSTSVRKTLAIEAGSQKNTQPDAEPHLKGILHALSYFGIPLILVAVLGSNAREFSPQQEVRALKHDAEVFASSASVQFAYGKAALSLGQKTEAKAAFQRAVSLASSFHGPALALFNMEQQLGRIKASIRWGKAAAKARPEDPAIRHRLSRALYQTKNYKEAERHIRAALRWRKSHVLDLVLLAQIRHRLGRKKNALYLLKAAYRIAPAKAEVVLTYATMLFKSQKTTQGIKILKAYLKNKPQDNAATKLLHKVQKEKTYR